MENFRKYLLNSRLANQKTAEFYVYWVVQFFSHCRKHPGDEFNVADLDGYLKFKSRTCEPWQLEQAGKAIEIYRFWQSRRSGKGKLLRMGTREQWKTVGEEMTHVIRLRHLSRRTEQAYLSWVRRFYWFINGDPPGTLKSSHVKDFLTHLAVDRKVGASTQNQAFNALLFLFRHVLDEPIEDLGPVIRAKRKKRLPVVLTQAEVKCLLGKMEGEKKLMAQVIYGGGLRLKECLHLRVKDVDVERKSIVIRSGKGDKDRETVLPESIVSILKGHLARIKVLHEKDRESNHPGVALPGALKRKYPNAGKEWGWFWFFPSHKLSIDPRSGVIRRHHAHKSVLQKHIKKAALNAKIYKQVTVHTLRHCFATHLVEQGCDIRTVQDLLGHRHLETTMIYTHVAQTNRLGIISPLDKSRKK